MIFYSYVLFPFILRLISAGKENNAIIFKPEDDLPFLSVIMSVHNEEKVIKNKIGSIYYTSYPINKFEVLIGSDASTDNTDLICRIFTENYYNLKFIHYNQRQGKPSIINKLTEQARGKILIITDANVIFGFTTMFHLARHFRNENVGLVDSHLKYSGLRKKGISIQENAYISREVKIKYFESRKWGCMMGPFGGCYAVKKELYEPVPPRFLVDDFYINMKVLSKGKKAISSMDAIVTEDISDDLTEEFRRKVRIASGNFQNLFAFRNFLRKPFSPVAFTFISHKIIRWLGPFFMILALISSLLLSDRIFFRIVIVFEAILILIPFVDFLLKKIKIHIVFLRYITHFLSMNLALLFGFIRSVGGINTNIWEPTRREQSEEY
jgi:cellulose synthase/poly-beta-1,6-N-acetylglucosamine synthase-like glycosyltransferase